MAYSLVITCWPLAYGLLALLALAVGSLLNVLIYRLPLMLQEEWQQECRILLNIEQTIDAPKINLFFPRSFCPLCKRPIPAWHNIPLLSYCWLRGRCHYCQQSICWRYPLIELMSCCLSLVAAWYFDFNLILVFALLFIWLLICLGTIDLNHQLLPDNLTLTLLWLGLIANTLQLFTTLPNAVLSAAGAYLLLWLFMQLFYLLTGKVGMGYGDFKLFAAFGAWFGWTQLPLILLIAAITGALTGIIYLKRQHKNTDTPIPFGPFLCLGGFIALFWGETIINWYLSFWFYQPFVR